jgi:3-oxoacyl-[acyl-carrier protein] reductase
MEGQLTGRVALVTGASKGIGAGIASALGAAGAHVAVAYGRDREGAERVAAAIEQAGGRATVVQGDMSKLADIESMVAATVTAFGPLSILVNNAGVFDYRPLEEITPEHFHAHFDTNVLGPLMLTKLAVANFNPAGGSIINVSSLASQGSAGGRAVYTATKAALNSITKVLALELAGRNIRVNGIMPGYVDTEGARAFGIPGSASEARLVQATPLGRPGRPSDFGPVAVFLASAASGWITGEILSVSGGLRG